MRTWSSFSALALTLALSACGAAHEDHHGGGTTSSTPGPVTGGSVKLALSYDEGETTSKYSYNWEDHGSSDTGLISCVLGQENGQPALLFNASIPIDGQEPLTQSFTLKILGFKGAGRYQAEGVALGLHLGANLAQFDEAESDGLRASHMLNLGFTASSTCTFVATSELAGNVHCSELAAESTDVDTDEQRDFGHVLALEGTWKCDELIDK
jgi:hypothetical protein